MPAAPEALSGYNPDARVIGDHPEADTIPNQTTSEAGNNLNHLMDPDAHNDTEESFLDPRLVSDILGVPMSDHDTGTTGNDSRAEAPAASQSANEPGNDEASNETAEEEPFPTFENTENLNLGNLTMNFEADFNNGQFQFQPMDQWDL